MAEGRNRAAWQHTSSIMCLIANINRDPKKTQAFRPGDFDPTRKRKGNKLPKMKMGDVKGLLSKAVQRRGRIDAGR